MSLNLLLLDHRGKYLNNFSDSEELKIHTAYVAHNDIKNKYKEEAAEVSVISYDDITNNTKIKHSYAELNSYEYMMHKVIRYTKRQISNINSINYLYYVHLSFWIDFFDNNDIDMIFSEGESGQIDIKIPMEVAKSKNIKVLVMENITASNDTWIHALKDYNTQEFIDFSRTSWVYPEGILDNHLYNSNHYKKKNKIPFREKISLFAYSKLGVKLFGVADLFLDLKVNFARQQIGRHELSQWYSKVDSVEKYYKSLTVKEVDFDLKYIYYPLHYEPEASFDSRIDLPSQLLAVKMISDGLPDGWKLYVKEHPSQYDIFNYKRWYYTINYTNYKDNSFYDFMDKLENVEILSSDVKSKELIDSAACVVTFVGTVAYEAINQKKPLMIFASEASPLQYCEDVFKIKSPSDINLAVNKLKNNFIPNYNDYERIEKKYFFEQNKETEEPKIPPKILIEALKQF